MENHYNKNVSNKLNLETFFSIQNLAVYFFSYKRHLWHFDQLFKRTICKCVTI